MVSLNDAYPNDTMGKRSSRFRALMTQVPLALFSLLLVPLFLLSACSLPTVKDKGEEADGKGYHQSIMSSDEREHQAFARRAAALNKRNRSKLTGTLSFARLPSSYGSVLTAGKRGKVEKISYSTTYQGKRYHKQALVYLPHGYGEKKWMRYNVIYLLHGFGGSITSYLSWPHDGGGKNAGSSSGLSAAARPSKIQSLLDHVMADGRMNPAIVVFPTYYPDSSFRTETYLTDGPLVKTFAQHEFNHDLVPAVESHYQTYSRLLDSAGQKASRTHRAFGGFSMGGAATWYSFQYNLSTISYFLPVAQSSWALYPHGGLTDPSGTARILADTAGNSNDFLIAGGAGSDDVTSITMEKQITAMRKQGKAFSTRNLEFGKADGQGHTVDAFATVLYNVLPFMFINTQF